MPRGAGIECYPEGFNDGLHQEGHDLCHEYDEAMAREQRLPTTRFPEISVRCCYEREDGEEFIPTPAFIMGNHRSLYPVIQAGIENEPGFPGWKELHDNLEELYLRNHGPDIWRIKESVKNIMRGKRPGQSGSGSTASREAHSPVLRRAQSNVLREKDLSSPHSLRAAGKARVPNLSFPKVMSSSGPSRVSALTSMLHRESPTDTRNLAAPTSSNVLEDLVNEMGGHEQGYSAVLSGCAIESYTPPGERRPVPPSLSTSSTSSSSEYNPSMRPMISLETYTTLRALREMRARLLLRNFPLDECAVESYTPSEDWDPLGWRSHEQDSSSCEDSHETCSTEDDDSSGWEKVQETADTLTPPPLPPANPPVIYPSPEMKPRVAIVPTVSVRPKAMKPRELIKIGKRRICRVVRSKRKDIVQTLTKH